MENNHIITKAIKGDEQAYRQLYERYHRVLFLICLRYMKERTKAEDCLQEGFINIFNHLRQYDEQKGSFEAWAKRIVVHVCLEKIRKRSLYIVEESEAQHIESDIPNALSKLSMQEMLVLIQDLPEGYRTIFNMYVIDGFSHREIAETLQISNNTSKTQLRKARLLLQKKIKHQQRILSVRHG